MMRSRPLVCLLATLALTRVSYAQDAGGAGEQGLEPGEYIRVSGGVATPIAARGSLQDWDRGAGFAAAWESWSAGPTGLGRAGFAITAVYNLLPLDEQRFVSTFIDPTTGQQATSATASRAGILEVTTNAKIRISMPLVTPMVNIGLGLLDWHPGTIRYTAGTATGTARQLHRTGLELTIGGGIDRTIVDRYAIFGEAMYVFGYTSYGGGYTSPGGVCTTSGCDALRNTTIGTIRAGLRARIGR
jgi:hypothetical protein